jgi:hypothetical protein
MIVDASVASAGPGRRTLRAAGALIGLAIWVAAVGVGFASLWRYTYEPGRSADAKAEWPAVSRVRRDPQRPTLVVMLSPGCPCSQATVSELARLLARAPDKTAVRALVSSPAQVHEGETPLEQTRLWRALTAIPGVDAIADRDGREAEAFGGYVSGQSFLYDASGRLRFSGGLTAARGHEGDNDGVDAVVALLTTGHAPIDRTPVFGCVLEGASPP